MSDRTSYRLLLRQRRNNDIDHLVGAASAGRSDRMAADVLVCAAIKTLEHGPFHDALLAARRAELDRIPLKGTT